MVRSVKKDEREAKAIKPLETIFVECSVCGSAIRITKGPDVHKTHICYDCHRAMRGRKGPISHFEKPDQAK